MAANYGNDDIAYRWDRLRTWRCGASWGWGRSAARAKREAVKQEKAALGRSQGADRGLRDSIELVNEIAPKAARPRGADLAVRAELAIRMRFKQLTDTNLPVVEPAMAGGKRAVSAFQQQDAPAEYRVRQRRADARHLRRRAALLPGWIAGPGRATIGAGPGVHLDHLAKETVRALP